MELTVALAENFPGKRVLIVGDLVADQFLYGSISRMSREAPVFILKHRETETRPGGAANAAANVASLGGRPILVGITGDDENGKRLRSSLAGLGVDREGVLTSTANSTTTKVRVLASHSRAARQQMYRIDYEDDRALTADLRGRLVENICRLADEADAIIISDYGYGVADNESFSECLKISQEHKIPLVIDSRFRLREFKGATSATPNREEVEQLLGPDFTDTDCERLCRELGLGSLLVTCGSQGMMLVEPGKSALSIPAVGAIEPVDVTGAGDTVIATYALGLASGLSLREAAIVANHAGAIAVTKHGTATVSAKELTESILSQDALTLADSAH
jgi:rfaE bifunctional protein kinase chain/domain